MSTLMPTFAPFVPSTDSWDAYLERFNCFLQANDLSDISSARKHGYFLSSCGSEVFNVARSLAAPQPLCELSWEVLLDKLRGHYAPAPSRIVRRHAFRCCFQSDSATINDFISSLRTAALHCEFLDLENMLLDQFVYGVKDLKLQRRLLARKDLTFQLAMDEARAAEMAEKSAAELHRFRPGTVNESGPVSIHFGDAAQGSSSGEEAEVSRLNLTSKRASLPESKRSQPRCLGCGGEHAREDCKFKSAVCRRCGKRGHLARVCRATLPVQDVGRSPVRWRGQVKTLAPRQREYATVAHFEDDVPVSYAASASSSDKIYVTVNLEGAPCTMEVDTGSSRSLIAWSTLQRLLPGVSKASLKPCAVTLRDYQGGAIPTVGVGKFRVAYHGFNDHLPLIVVKGDRPCLLGLDWFTALGLHIAGVHNTRLDVTSMLAAEFADVFDESLGKYRGSPISLNLDPQVAPIRLKPRRVPLALRPKVDEQLDRLIAQGVLIPIDHAKWETPIVIPLKPDGSVRICADYKGTINKALQANPYPVPVVQHLLHSLGKGRIFAKLDMAQAYQQLPVDDETALAQTIVTHRGAFKCTRLQFGVSVAPGIFQGIMERLLHEIPGVVPYFDDVIVSARDMSELVTKVSDHKPLLGLLAGDRPTPQILSPRMSRWAEFLAAYSYRLVHRPGKEIGHADALSRCPLPAHVRDPAPSMPILLIEESDCPVAASDICWESGKDPVMSQVIDWVRRGWPQGTVAPEFLPYVRRRGELSTQSGCLLWGHRVVVPPTLRPQILSCLHVAHPGIGRMKALGRSYVWWPNLDQEIESWVGRCHPCQSSRAAPPAAPVRDWETPRGPWARIHADLAGPFQGRTFLVVVDAYSKWVELVLTPSTTADSIIKVLDKLFSTHGLPDVLVTDNDPQFFAAAFQLFLARLGIRHAPTAPFHPAANGLAERAVRSAKDALGHLRRLRTVLDRLHPTYGSDRVPAHEGRVRSFGIEDLVYAQNFGDVPQWLPGHIIQLSGPYSYRVLLEDGRIWRRHINQLRRRLPTGEDDLQRSTLHQDARLNPEEPTPGQTPDATGVTQQ
ncbi:uncharacterized protein K02A2.6-like [Ahaetulla prasina]|uniref:uncharacterized protein K02A2.6-like n=1 Tax=Ahaetulla prasina TaxID=499056 RepID=UPI00264799DD|nr:uncharacterized protein K02A2.6-like [Ahaetulla prasina]